MRKRFKLVKVIENTNNVHRGTPGNVYRNSFGDFFISTGTGWVGLRRETTPFTDLLEKVKDLYINKEKLLTWSDIEIEVEDATIANPSARITNYWLHMQGFASAKKVDNQTNTKLYKRLPDFGIF